MVPQLLVHYSQRLQNYVMWRGKSLSFRDDTWVAKTKRRKFKPSPVLTKDTLWDIGLTTLDISN